MSMLTLSFFCCCSVTNSCPTFCDPMACSMPGFLPFTISPSLPILMFSESVMPSNHLIFCLPSSSCLQCFPTSGSFQMSQLFASGGQNIGVSASTSVLPMNTQDWFPLGWTGWISLQSKGLSRELGLDEDMWVVPSWWDKCPCKEDERSEHSLPHFVYTKKVI